jgi:SSS family solute:Na+ symporter
MLGAFLLGVLTKRANQTGVIAGMLASITTMLIIKFATDLAWTWYVLVGTVICLSVGYVVSRIFSNRGMPVVETTEDTV